MLYQFRSFCNKRPLLFRTATQVCGLQIFLAAILVVLCLVVVLLFGVVEEEPTIPTITLGGWEGLFPNIRVLEGVPTCYIPSIRGTESLTGDLTKVLFLTYTEEYTY